MLVCVGIPTIDGKPCAQTVDSLLAEQLLGFGQGIHFLVMWEIGCSLIGVARNKLARQFLDQKEADCIIFVDSDISWKAGELAKLAMHPADVIGGTYRAKQEDVKFHVRGAPEAEGSLFKVEGIPGGFIKISRNAFESIKANQYEEEGGRVMSDYFPTGYQDGCIWGEDYGFCRLYRENGGTVYLNPDIPLRHHDGSRHFAGDARSWLWKVMHP